MDEVAKVASVADEEACKLGLSAFAAGDYRRAARHFAHLPRALPDGSPCQPHLLLRLFLAGKADPWLVLIYGACAVLFGVVVAHYFGWGSAW